MIQKTTRIADPEEVGQKKWYLLDATGKTVGKLSVEAARTLSFASGISPTFIHLVLALSFLVFPLHTKLLSGLLQVTGPHVDAQVLGKSEVWSYRSWPACFWEACLLQHG